MKKIISLFALAAITLPMYAQQLKTYSGPYELNRSGKATYTYYDASSGERIYHGNFSFRSSDAKFPLSAISGNFKNGVKDGKWRIMEGKEGLPLGYIRPIGYHIAEGTFRNGYIDGEYAEYEMEILDEMNEMIDAFVIHIDEAAVGRYYPNRPCLKTTIRNNKIIGKIYALLNGEYAFSSEGTTELNGQTNERGRAHGTWTIKRTGSSSHIVELREYFEGICCKVVRKDNSRGTISITYQLPEDFVTALQNTYNSNTNSFVYQNDRYLLVPYGNMRGDVGNGMLFSDCAIDDDSKKILKGGSSDALRTFNCIIGTPFLCKSYDLPDKSDVKNNIETPFSVFKNIDLLAREKAKAEAEAEALANARNMVVNYKDIEKKPSFQGGDHIDFYKFVSKRVRYPQSAQERGISGTVAVSFDVDADGDVVNARIVKSPDDSLSDAVLQVVRNSPKWKPGSVNGRPVRVTGIVIQIRFGVLN